MTAENTERKKYRSISHGLGVAGLILGTITLLISFIPCFGVFASLFAIITILISLIGLGVALKHGHPKEVIIVALVAAIIACAIVYIQKSAMNGMFKEVYEIENQDIED